MKESEEVAALYAGVERAMNMPTTSMRGVEGRQVGDCKHGVYLFYDYDNEPIYVGQTQEKLRTRIRRHLTNQRTDAVAMRVLDPFEVAEIEMWPFWTLHGKPKGVIEDTLDRAEYTVYQNALKASKFNRILNEKEIAEKPAIELPPSIRESILEGAARKSRSHPDVRLARRARTIAELARIISERKVNIGLRNTLLSQAVRLEHLARNRLEQVEKRKNK